MPSNAFQVTQADPDLKDLQEADNSIEDRSMTVKTEPQPDSHPRYESDGKRYVEKSRVEPMAINV